MSHAQSPIVLFGNLQNGIAKMKMIALFLAFALAGCTGNRLSTETKPIAVPLPAAPGVTFQLAILKRLFKKRGLQKSPSGVARRERRTTGSRAETVGGEYQ